MFFGAEWRPDRKAGKEAGEGGPDAAPGFRIDPSKYLDDPHDMNRRLDVLLMQQKQAERWRPKAGGAGAGPL